MIFHYVATREINDITQSFVFNLVNLNKTPADINTLMNEADTVISAIEGLDNPLWETGSVVKKAIAASESPNEIVDWKAAVDVGISFRNYNAAGKANFYYNKFKNIAISSLITQINNYISNIGTGLTTNNFYITLIEIDEHL